MKVDADEVYQVYRMQATRNICRAPVGCSHRLSDDCSCTLAVKIDERSQAQVIRLTLKARRKSVGFWKLGSTMATAAELHSTTARADGQLHELAGNSDPAGYACSTVTDESCCTISHCVQTMDVTCTCGGTSEERYLR